MAGQNVSMKRGLTDDRVRGLQRTFSIVLRISNSSQLPLLLSQLNRHNTIPLRILRVAPCLDAIQLSSQSIHLPSPLSLLIHFIPAHHDFLSSNRILDPSSSSFSPRFKRSTRNEQTSQSISPFSPGGEPLGGISPDVTTCLVHTPDVGFGVQGR